MTLPADTAPTDAAAHRRWAAGHGLVRAAVARRARDGVDDALLATDPALHADPTPAWARMRASYPFAPGALPGSLATVHLDVARAVLTSDAFGMPGRAGPAGGPPGPLDPPSLVALDGADHAHHRARLTRTFSARAVARWEPRVVEVASELLDALPARTSDAAPDLVAGYARPLPMRIITEILGLPGAPSAELSRWGDAVADALDVGHSRAGSAAIEADLDALATWLRRRVARARGSGAAPGGVLADLTGDPEADTEDVVTTLVFLLAAGFDTSTHLLSGGAALLASHPAARDLLRAEPARWPDAVEEVLRVATPVTRASRRARREVDVAGTVVAAGTLVTVHTAAANRDPAVFADPDRFDVDRADVRAHLGFSAGAHHCLGAALARLEGAVGLRALVERHPDLRLDGPGPWRPSRLVRGRATLPVRW